MQLSGLEVLGVLNLHRDYCNDDVGNTFVTEWTFKSVIKSAQRNRCGSISRHEGPGLGHKDNSSLHVCVEGKQAVMLLFARGRRCRFEDDRRELGGWTRESRTTHLEGRRHFEGRRH